MKCQLIATALLLVTSSAAFSQTVLDGPSAFGSIAIPRDVPMTARERAAITTPVSASRLGFLGGMPARSLAGLQRLNTRVNTHVARAYDAQTYGLTDYWARADETLDETPQGDDEDIAIAKMRILMRAGFPPQDLFLVFSRPEAIGVDRAVLLVRLNGRLYVLGPDNAVVDAGSASFRGFTAFSPTGRTWLYAVLRRVGSSSSASN